MTSRDHENEVARLLQESGPRPEVSDERIAAAMAAARPAWQAKVAEQKRHHIRWRPFLLAAAVAGLALLAGWWTRPLWLPPPTVAWVELASGQNLADGQPLVPGASVLEGAEITVDGLLALRLEAGGSLRLDRGTSARLTGPSELDLEAGAAYFDSRDDGPGREHPTNPDIPALTVTTEWGVVRDIGTQFEVRLLENQLAVRVREGRVELSREGRQHLATAGEELRLEPDGEITRTPLPPGTPTFDWVIAASPPFDFTSGDLVAFFQWAARETGTELIWQPAELMVEVETITFHGSVEGLTPLEALEVVAAATGLEVRITGQGLEIRRAS